MHTDATTKRSLDENHAVLLPHNPLVGDHSCPAPVSPQSILTGDDCFEKYGGDLVSQRSQGTGDFYSNCSNFYDDIRVSVA